MRFLTRLHAVVAAAIVFILYFSWCKPSLRMQDNLSTVWTGTAHRLVVFGDDWSDTGRYRVASPPAAVTRDRDPLRGPLWVESLCESLNCDYIDNFARSVQSETNTVTVGSVVNHDIVANATGDESGETPVLFDFGTQVHQFIQLEKQRTDRLLPGRLREIDEWTVFTVFFGVWDLMAYAALDKETATFAIDRSIDDLIHNLDLLADHASGPVKVVMPALMDITFLPRFSSRRNESAPMYAQDQHKTVWLWTYWNMILSAAAAEWSHGELFIPDLHGIVMNQVRKKQLYSKQSTAMMQSTGQQPLFDNVEQPCLTLVADNDPMPAAVLEKCSEPEQHLFWDDMHLSGKAHQLIGQAAFRLLQSNITVNRYARLQAQEEAVAMPDHRKDTRFALKFPPGY